MKIIYIITFSPRYEYLKSLDDTTGMTHYWLNHEGKKIGVFEKDWGCIILKKMKELFPAHNYEVWRPDTRADKIYEYEFPEGYKHLSFPSQKIRSRFGLKKMDDEYSSMIINRLEDQIKNDEKPVIIIPFVTKRIFREILSLFNKKVPILVPHLLNNGSLVPDYSTRNIFSLLHRYLIQREKVTLLKKVKYFTIGHWKYEDLLRRKYRFELQFFNPGFDKSELMDPIPKKNAREYFRIPENEAILLASSRLVSEKQIDKLIEVLSRLKSYKWQLYVTGYGDKSHVQKIEALIKEDNLSERIHLLGFVSDEELTKLFCAADLFCMTSFIEGGPISALKAFWYKLPIFTTDTGAMAEFLDKNNTGLIVPADDYDRWSEKLSLFLKGQPITMPDQKLFIETFNIGNNIKRLYEMALSAYNNC